MTSYRSFSYFLISLFLLFSVISSVNSLPHAKKDDPCIPVVATKNPKYKDVKNCLTSFPYNASAANEIIDLLKKYTSDFYVLFNQAREKAKPGFTFESVDIIKELDNILKSNPKTEFEFMNSVRNTYKKLRDAHTQFIPSCYGDFLFEQKLHLYSVIEQGKQIIKVFNDSVDPKNIDCEVSFIDSIPAFDAIKNFANNYSFISRDLGVRLNNALTSISLKDGNPWFLGSEFTVRVDLPETDSIEYTLSCPNKVPKKFKREWFVTFSQFIGQNESFYQDHCLNNNGGPKKLKHPKKTKALNIAPYIFHPKVKELLTKNPQLSEPIKLSKATKVFDAGNAQFYKSINSDFGIVVLIDESGDPESTLEGFKTLAKDKSIKKLVIDLSNNPGGSIVYAQFFDALLIPSSNFTPFPDDMNVQSDLVKKIITKDFKNVEESSFDPNQFINFENGKPYGSSKQFIGSNEFKRGDRFSKYSTKHFFETNLTGLIKLPWDTKNIIILSNGASGSAASLISQYLQEVGQIRTVSVGGIANQDLSFASFTGGQSYDSFRTFSDLSELNITDLAPLDGRYNNLLLTFTLREAYSLKDNNTVLDFDFRPADHRLYYDTKNIRDPSLLWVESAKLIK